MLLGVSCGQSKLLPRSVKLSPDGEDTLPSWEWPGGKGWQGKGHERPQEEGTYTPAQQGTQKQMWHSNGKYYCHVDPSQSQGKEVRYTDWKTPCVCESESSHGGTGVQECAHSMATKGGVAPWQA